MPQSRFDNYRRSYAIELKKVPQEGFHFNAWWSLLISWKLKNDLKTHQNFSGLAEKDDAQIFDGKTDKECTKSYIVRQTTKDEIIQMYKDLVIDNKKHLLIAIEGTSLIS